MIQKSAYVILAVDTKNDKVVGFINAISDFTLAAYIPLLEVLPEYHKRGIGKELVRRMLKKLDKYYMVDLVCDNDLKPFYAQFNMKPAVGMIIRNYNKQSGQF